MNSLMMDLPPVYDQREDGDRVLNFETEQIPRLRQLQAQSGGRMSWFVAYNPYREHWPSTRPPGYDLRIVQNAVQNYGALGVKVYPPSGYRPAGNDIPDPPRAFISSKPREQWRARYTRNGTPITNEELDQQLLNLCLWCAANDVPIIAHCGQGEFEARKKYGVWMPDPQYWRELLQNEQHAAQLRNLRLCLAHAGGDDAWFRKFEENGTWSSEVFKLCTEFPHVYCEFGIHSDIADPTRRARFTENLHERIMKSREPSSDGTPQYDFGRKIMYGSDWFMPMATIADRSDYVRRFQQALLTGSLERDSQHYVNFFLGNALDFLNASQRSTDPRLPANLRATLRQLENERRVLMNRRL
jgi:hypothetical protein